MIEQKKLLREKDPFIEFETEDCLLGFLKQMQNEDRWIMMPMSALKAGYVQAGLILENSYPDADQKQIAHAYANGTLYLQHGKNKYLLNECALFTLNDRAGITSKLSASLLIEKKYEAFCRLMNLGFKNYGEKDCLTLVRAGQIIASHSARYVSLSQVEVFSRAKESILDRFPNATFQTASYSHDITSALYSLANYKEKLLEEYLQAWVDAGFSASSLCDAHPVLVINTSDTGRYCVEIVPMLSIGHMNYPLGDKIQIKHHGNASISQLDRKIGLAYSRLVEGLAMLTNLLSIQITHPVEALIHAAEESGLVTKAKKAARALVEAYKLCIIPGETVTAYELYTTLCEIKYTDEFARMSPSAKLKVTENLYRLLSLDWLALDYPGKQEVI